MNENDIDDLSIAQQCELFERTAREIEAKATLCSLLIKKLMPHCLARVAGNDDLISLQEVHVFNNGGDALKRALATLQTPTFS